MIKRDYEAIADAMVGLRWFNRHEVIAGLAEYFRKYNPTFKEEGFLKAAQFNKRYVVHCNKIHR